MKNYLSIILLLAFQGIFSQEIRDAKFGKGMINYIAKDSSFSVNFAPRIQSRYESKWSFDGKNNETASTNFSIRRARLKFEGYVYSPKLKYKIELGLSNRDISGANVFNRNTPKQILDAVLMWNFYKKFELWAGQTKLPGNIERVVSSGNLQFIDRSLLNSKFNIDRDMGIQLRNKSKIGNQFIIKEKFAISQGEGRNITEGNLGGYQYTSRIEFFPFGEFKSKGNYIQGDLVREKSLKTMIGFTYDINKNAVKNRSNMGSYLFLNDKSLFETDITTYFLDGVMKYNGFAFTGEYAFRTADNIVIKESDDKIINSIAAGSAINFHGSYIFNSNFELAIRYTDLDFMTITGLADLKQFTIGFSKYIVGHKLKFQSDLSLSSRDNQKDYVQFRTGFDLHF